MSTVNGIHELRPVFAVDCNQVVCQAAKHPQGHTVVTLVTPNDAWTKELIISATNVFGYQLKCGDHDGHPMSGLNKDMKFNSIDLGDRGSLAIQFLKAKTFGIMTDYGTLTLPESVRGYAVAFFWPNDAPGDHWNHFINILKQGEHVTESVAGIAGNVVKIGKDAAEFLAMFGI